MSETASGPACHATGHARAAGDLYMQCSPRPHVAFAQPLWAKLSTIYFKSTLFTYVAQICNAHCTLMRTDLQCPLYTATAQVLEKVDQLVFVRPLKTRYEAAQGDVVVGRVTEVGFFGELGDGSWELGVSLSLSWSQWLWQGQNYHAHNRHANC